VYYVNANDGSGNNAADSNGGGQFNLIQPGVSSSAIVPNGTNIAINAANTGVTAQSSGTGQAHNNMQPYLAINYIIKVR
jgi:microcystin-dependent protein